VEEFRSASRSEVVDVADEPRQFYRLTPGKKMIVMLGGPSMNLVIYVVLTFLLLMVIGQPEQDPTLTVSSVAQCVVAQNSTDAQKGVCPAGAPAAAAAGVLKPGDVIVAVDGTPMKSWDDAVDVIQASAGKSLNVTIKRAGVDQVVTLTPVENVKYASDTGTKTIRAGYIGVGPQVRDYHTYYSVAQVPGQIVKQFALGLRAMGSYPSKIHSLWGTVFEGKARDPNGAVGVVGLGEIGGQVAQTHGLALRDKIFFLLSLLASVNLLLFLFNLLPLLPLDGGHVAGAIVEAAKRGRARLRDRVGSRSSGARGDDAPTRSPIYVDTAQMLPVMYAVASVLIVLTLLVVYADIVKPIHIGS
jgi:membrane-associated protease RseP (regulator of RpoE activity)